MADSLLFAMGLFVTAIVGLAVWTIGRLDVDDDSGSEARDRRGEGRW